MGSRAISGLVFGLCFAIVLSVLSLFTPHVRTYHCGTGTKKTYSIAGVISFGADCVGGGNEETVGFPLATSKKSVPPSIRPDLLTEEQKKSEYQYQPAGIFGNFVIYWLVGFVFFFIFSRSRHRYHPNVDEQGRGNKKRRKKR